MACIGISNDFGRPPEQQDQQFELIRRGIDVAQYLGAPVVRLFAGYVARGDDRQAVWDRSVAGLRRAAQYSFDAGVAVGLQNHNHNNVTSTGNDVLRLIKQVDHPNCTHILDTGQYVGSLGAGGAQPEDPKKYDVYHSIEQTAPLAVLVRAKLYRLRDGREQWLDYDRIFPVLRRQRFNGFVSLVYEGWQDQDATHAVPIGVDFLRRYLNAKA
jgi:sugar phosphate isomerase/epimerase